MQRNEERDRERRVKKELKKDVYRYSDLNIVRSNWREVCKATERE